MSGIDYSQPIVGAGASARTDFAAAQARTGLDFRGAARFKRGVKAELGVEAFADASAEVSKFVRASIAGTAFARAQAGIQLQLPLNLFSEFGFAARAEAIAEAAAGLRVDLGLSIGDFVLLAQRDPESVGLPIEVLLLFLEEVSIGGNFEINVAAAAKAHASLTIAGRVIEKPGHAAGFYYTIDAGVGLAAGVGMGFAAGAEFKDFRRFFVRATDKVVDAVILETVRHVGQVDRKAMVIARAFAPVAKIALRSAHDIGQKIFENNPLASTQNMNTLCNEAVKTVLEECQRFLLDALLQGAIDGVHAALQQQAAALGKGPWDTAFAQRSALANRLLAMPADPYQPTDGNLDYWRALVSDLVALFDKIYGARVDPVAMEHMSVLYATSELLIEAVRSKVNKASAYAMAIGAGTVDADTKPYRGVLSPQPVPAIRRAINTTLGANPNTPVDYADLLRFLVRDEVVNRLLGTSPGATEFMKMFTTHFGKTEKELVKVFLQNAASFVPAPGGGAQMDPHATLQAFVNAFDAFITKRFQTQALPIILQHVPAGVSRRYIEEVLLEAVLYVKDVGLRSILDWQNKTFDNDDFTEALAGVMMLLLGRTVVLVGDTFVTATQERFAEVCAETAARIRNGDPAIAPLGLATDPDLLRIVADSVDIAGEVLGPLPTATRTRIRQLLYQVMEPIPPGRGQDFLESLADQFFIPNEEDLQALTHELATISRQRFGEFARRSVLAIGNHLLEQLETLLLGIVDLVVNWEAHLADALAELGKQLRNLDAELARLNAQLVARFEQADRTMRDFLQSLSGPSLKSALRTALRDLVLDKALDSLQDNAIYKNLPRDLRRRVRNTLESAIRELVDGPLVEPVLQAIGTVSNALEDLMVDARELDPDENLPEQILRLVQDKIEDAIRDQFGSTRPHVDIAFSVPYRDLLGNPHTWHFSLGRVSFDLDPFLDAVHDSIDRLDFYHGALDDACVKLAMAFAKELELAAARLRRDEARRDQGRLSKIAADHDCAPRDIAILNPVQMSHHESKIAAKIHLGGVPASFLGLGKDEQQRVFVFLNGDLVPRTSMALTESESDAPQAASASRGSALDTTDRVRTPIAAGAQTQRKAAPKLAIRSKQDINGRGVVDHRLDNVMPGRGNPASRIGQLMRDRMAGMLIQIDLTPDKLVEGVNTLTVVVIERGGQRHQQNVAFTVARRAVPVPPRRPGLAGLPATVTLSGRVAASWKPGRPVALNLSESGRPKPLNTLLPADAKTSARRQSEALKHLRKQAASHFQPDERR
jgi:hypothetical protein